MDSFNRREEEGRGVASRGGGRGPSRGAGLRGRGGATGPRPNLRSSSISNNRYAVLPDEVVDEVTGDAWSGRGTTAGGKRGLRRTGI